jgi:hypothetical protein
MSEFHENGFAPRLSRRCTRSDIQAIHTMVERVLDSRSVVWWGRMRRMKKSGKWEREDQ